jgi:O-methyltransferase involved in polyketide biosynthesis
VRHPEKPGKLGGGVMSTVQPVRAGSHGVPPVRLDGVPETALITLFNRASEAQRPGGLIDDPLAVSLLAAIDYPFAVRFGRPDQSHVLRAVAFDQWIRSFLRDHPQGTVVALGEGLETQLWRVDNGGVRWISVDLPEMIELRGRLLPEHPRNQLVPCSALDPAWAGLAGPGTQALIVAQGLLMYFTDPEVDGFFDMVAERCPGAAVLFDTIPAWAATSVGHRQNRSYRLPPQPWGVGRRQVLEISRRHRDVAGVRILPVPRGRGPGWGILYPAATRIPGLRGLLPQTAVVTTCPPETTPAGR